MRQTNITMPPLMRLTVSNHQSSQRGLLLTLATLVAVPRRKVTDIDMHHVFDRRA